MRHLKLSRRLLVEAWSVPAPLQPAARAELGFGAGSRSQRNTIKSLCYWEMCSLDGIGRDLSADSASDTDYLGALCHFSAGLRTSATDRKDHENDGVKLCCVTSWYTITNPHSLSRCRVILFVHMKQNVVSPPLPVFVNSWNTLIRCFCPSCKMNHTVGQICIWYFIHWSCSGHNSWYYLSLIQISLVSYWHI